MRIQAGVITHRVGLTDLLDNRFDGDALNFFLPLENKLTHEFRHLKPHKSAFDMEKPFNISDNVVMPKPAIGMQANWMHMDEPPTERDLDIRRIMYALPDA